MRKKSTKGKSEIPVVILCGGKGTRLQEETSIIPKPLVAIGNEPILWHIMKIYYAQGYRRFVLLLGYKGEKIKDYFLHYPNYSRDFTLTQRTGEATIAYHSAPRENWSITFLDTNLETETGGRLKKLERLFRAEKRFMLTYGDGVADVDLSRALQAHLQSKRLVTMTAVRPRSRFGEIRSDANGSWRFLEKPDEIEKRINGGFFIVEKSLLKKLSSDPLLNFEKNVLPELAQTGELNLYLHDGYWHCMDTLHDVGSLNEAWSGDNAPWKLWH